MDQEPFSPEIRQWLRDHTEVRDALKIIVRSRFVPLHAISVVDNPDLTGVNQAIGIFSIDTKQNNKVKQDYLMHETNGTYVLFTGLPDKIRASQYVQHVKTLESRYGSDGANFYRNHHPKLEWLAPEIRQRIEESLKRLSGD